MWIYDRKTWWRIKEYWVIQYIVIFLSSLKNKNYQITANILIEYSNSPSISPWGYLSNPHPLILGFSCCKLQLLGIFSTFVQPLYSIFHFKHNYIEQIRYQIYNHPLLFIVIINPSLWMLRQTTCSFALRFK